MAENIPSLQSEIEQKRLKALKHLNVLDSPFEAVFDSVTHLASEVCGMPIALIALIDEHRQWFKANTGLPGIIETPRATGMCARTILQDDLLEINDATEDAIFFNNPYVMGEPFIKFYAGVPIKLPLGENIGTLCVIDTKPNKLNEFQIITLKGLARITSHLLVARRVSLQTSENLLD